MTPNDFKEMHGTPHMFVVERLRALRRTPRMWACTREAFAAQVALLLEFVGTDPRHLMQKFFFKVPHMCKVDVEKFKTEVDDTWARELINEAAALAELDLAQ